MNEGEFTTRGNVAAFLQQSGIIAEAIQQESLDRAIVEATATIRNYTNQYISRVAGDTVRLDGGSKMLFLPELPVGEIVTVTEDGEELIEDDDFVLGRYDVVYRLKRPTWAAGHLNISVTYSHGYQMIPQDITDVATRIASRVYQAGLRATETNGVPGVSAKSLGDFSVSYSAEPLGSMAGEGMLGVSGARFLLMSEKDILNRYRIKRQL
jgi:hypothetical protein